MQVKTLQHTAHETATELPEDLDAAATKLVYLALSTAGPTTVDDLRSRLNMEKLTLFPILDRLADADLVERDGDQYVAH